MKTEIKIKRLSDAARKYRTRKGTVGVKWPAEFQERAREVILSGVSVSQLSRAIGVDWRTLKAWSGGLAQKPRKPGFRKLRVVGLAAKGGRDVGPVKTVVTTTQGSEIVGLTAVELAALIKSGVL